MVLMQGEQVMFEQIKNRIQDKSISSFPEYDTEFLQGLFDEDNKEVEPFTVSKNLKVAYISYNKDGIFGILLTNTEGLRTINQIVHDFKKELKLYMQGVFLFVKSPEKEFFVSEEGIKEVESIDDCMEILANNVLLSRKELSYFPYMTDFEFATTFIEPKESHNPDNVVSTGIVYMRPTPRVLEDFEYILEEYIKKLNEDPHAKVRFDENGNRYEKHPVFKFGIVTGEAWFPVSSDDPDSFLTKTALGGIFGLHKFSAMQIGKGLLYFLTCGGFAIAYIFDILSLFIGDYHVNQTTYDEDDDGRLRRYKRKIYMGRPKKTLKNITMALAGVLTSIILLMYVYLPVMGSITRSVAIMIVESTQNKVEEVENNSADIENTILDMFDTWNR